MPTATRWRIAIEDGISEAEAVELVASRYNRLRDILTWGSLITNAEYICNGLQLVGFNVRIAHWRVFVEDLGAG